MRGLLRARCNGDSGMHYAVTEMRRLPSASYSERSNTTYDVTETRVCSVRVAQTTNTLLLSCGDGTTRIGAAEVGDDWIAGTGWGRSSSWRR